MIVDTKIWFYGVLPVSTCVNKLATIGVDSHGGLFLYLMVLENIINNSMKIIINPIAEVFFKICMAMCRR